MMQRLLIAMWLCADVTAVRMSPRRSGGQRRRRRRRVRASIARRSTSRCGAQDDLFRHVNGSWLAKTEIPADKSSYGAFDILFDKSQDDLRAIVEDAVQVVRTRPSVPKRRRSATSTRAS